MLIDDATSTPWLMIVSLAAAYLVHRWARSPAEPRILTPSMFRRPTTAPPIRRTVPGAGGEAEGWFPVRVVGPDVDIDTTTHFEQAIAELKDQVFGEQIRQGKRITLISQGRRLDDASTITESRIEPNCTIHCVISEGGAASQAPPSSMPQIPNFLEGIQPGHIAIALKVVCGAVLIVFWSMWFHYGSRMVNGFAVLMLVCLSLLYLSIVSGATFPAPQHYEEGGRSESQETSWSETPQGRATSYLTAEEISRMTGAES